MNIKAIFKSIIAGATLVGGAILGNEARKAFTKPVAPEDEFDDDDVFCEDTAPAEEADDEQAEEAD